MARDKVGDVIDLDRDRTESPRDPEAAAEAIEQLAFTGEPPTPAPETLPPVVTKPKRRTKAELEAEVTRLESEAQQREAAAAASAPDLIDAMRSPLELTFKAAGNIMASWKGDHWKLPDDEAQLLASAWAPCIGPVLAKHPEAILWASAIAVTYSVAYPRIQMDKTLALKAGEAQPQQEKGHEVLP